MRRVFPTQGLTQAQAAPAGAGTAGVRAAGATVARVADPVLTREGNLRFAAIASAGYPADPAALHAEVLRLLAGQEAEPYGAVTLLFSVPPEDRAPPAWECQVGTPITGLARPMGAMVIEDYRQLTSLSLPHAGPVRELPATWRRLEAHARAAGQRLRPYWRLALRDRRLADGNLLPIAEAAVFVDR